MALDDDDMTTPPTGSDRSEPADPYAEAPIGAGELSGQDGGADGGADAGADRPTDGSGAGADDPTTEADEDTRFA